MEETTFVRESFGEVTQGGLLSYYLINCPRERFEALRVEFRSANPPITMPPTTAISDLPCCNQWRMFFGWLATQGIDWKLEHRFEMCAAGAFNFDLASEYESPSMITRTVYMQMAAHVEV